jgi:hypothetical protein
MAKPQVITLNEQEKKAQHIIQEVARSKITILFVGSPRTGKTMTCRAVLGEKLLGDPNTQVFISACRDEPWFGWEKEPNFQVSNGHDTLPIIRTVDEVFQIYKQRAETPGDERGDMPPVALVLDDWNFQQNLLESLNIKDYQSVFGKLRGIISNGASVNITVMATLHSATLSKIKFLDSFSRTTVGLFVLGRVIHNPETGWSEGGYDSIWRVAGNNSIFSSDFRQKMSPVLAEKIKERDANGFYAPYPLALLKFGAGDNQCKIYDSIGDTNYIRKLL